MINGQFIIVHTLYNHMTEVGYRTRYPGPGIPDQVSRTRYLDRWYTEAVLKPSTQIYFQIVNPIMIYPDRHYISTTLHHLHFIIQQRLSMKVVSLPKM